MNSINWLGPTSIPTHPMNLPPTVGLKPLMIFGLSFVKQLAHGLVKRFGGYVTLLNAFVLVNPVPKSLSLIQCQFSTTSPRFSVSPLSRSSTFFLIARRKSPTCGRQASRDTLTRNSTLCTMRFALCELLISQPVTRHP